MPPTKINTVQEAPRPWHRNQRDLVAASLIAVPAAKRPTHRRWA
jgi:hypothetical protein